MKKCKNCNVEMVDAEISGQHPLEIGIDSQTVLYVNFSKGKEEVKGLFGKTKIVENYDRKEIKAKLCPECGKIELYVDLTEK